MTKFRYFASMSKRGTAGELRIVNAKAVEKDEPVWVTVYETGSTVARFLGHGDYMMLIAGINGDSLMGWRILSKFGHGKVYLDDIVCLSKRL